METLNPSNTLLRSLSKADLVLLKPALERVPLRSGQTLYEMEDRVDWIYLPEVGLLSLITVMRSGAALETSIVGREGGVGFLEALGSGIMFSRVIVQIPGHAYRLRVAEYRKAFNASPALRTTVHRQLELLQAESRQAIGCHGLHDVKQRFGRWLLECQDLSGGLDVMPLTQEFLAVMLGVSRTAITHIASEARAQGLIRYARGSVTVLDRAGLEANACECRASVQHLRRAVNPEGLVEAFPGGVASSS